MTKKLTLHFTGKTLLFLFFQMLYILITTGCHVAAQEIYLSDIKPGFIANEFGPPNVDQSYNKHSITIDGKVFTKGLGVHAPSRLCMDLNGNGFKFSATVGMDDETDRIFPVINQSNNEAMLDVSRVEQRGMVRFLIEGDDEVLYSSGWVSPNSQGIAFEVDISGINKLCLRVDHGPDGPQNTSADWADAMITMKNSSNTEQLKLYSQPEEILLNQTGFISRSPKTFRIAGVTKPDKFSVIDITTDKEVFSGETTMMEGDWGNVTIGDFSKVTEPGRYYIRYGNQESIPFIIHPLQYIQNLKKHLNWFLWQRCGDPEHGWERGQHQDDGRRLDNDRHQDVSGGWHDAADLRKWGMTINGLWALSEINLTLNSSDLPQFTGKRDIMLQVKDEIAWGNKYFQAMQEPAGYLMSQVGGDVYQHGDNNRFTDNISGTPDDRWIVTTPNDPVFQFMFIISQCNISLAENLVADNPYVEKAKRCFEWATGNNIISNIHELGAALTASLKLYKATGEKKYQESAKTYLEILLNRQNSSQEPIFGFFGEWDPDHSDSDKDYPVGELSYQLITPNFPIWSIVESIRMIDDPKLIQRAKNAFTIYVTHFIRFFDQRSSYGIVPMALYPNDPGGDRKAGNYYYRWCYVNHEDGRWWNGINPRIGYAGACLVRGGMLTNNPLAIRIGQQQLDFIYGCNPFNASTATGLGYNQPEYFKTSEFVPHTPLIIGAVMAGIGSSEEDLPVLMPAHWQTTEYWMEAVGGTIMLLNELNRFEFQNDK